MAHVIDAILTLKDHFSAQLKHVSENLSAFEKKSKKITWSMRQTSKAFERTGLALTKGLTIPIGAMAIASGKAAIDFESAFAGVKKTVNASGEELEKLKQGIQALSNVMPESSTEISKVAESAGQLGIKKDNILDFTKTVIMLKDSTNLLAEEASTTFARFANITQMSQDKFSNLGSSVVALGNNSATTESEITEMGLRIAGAGHQIGLSQPQIMGFSAAISSVGIQAEAGGSSFSKVISDMSLAVQTGNKQLGKFAKIAGMSGKEFQKAFKTNAAGAITSFIHGLGEAKKHGKSAIKMLDDAGITELRARDTLLRLAGAGNLVNKSLDISNKAWKENTALQNEANQRYATTASKLKILRNKLVNLGIKIGGYLLPSIQRFADKLGNLVDKFEKLNPHTQQAIIKFSLIAAAIGPVLLIIAKLSDGVRRLIFNFTLLIGHIRKVGGVMAFLSTPGMIVIGVIAALVIGAILIVTHWKQVSNCFMWVAKKISHFTGITKAKLMKIINVFKRFANIIKTRVVKAFQGLVSKVKPHLMKFINTLKRVFNQIKPILLPILAFLCGAFVVTIMAAFSMISTGISTAINFIGSLISGLLDILGGIIDFLVGAFTGNWTQCWNGIKSIFSGLCTTITGLWDGIVSLLSAPVQAIVDILDSAFHDKIDKIKKAWESVKTFLSHPIQGIVSLVQHGDLSGVGKNALGTPYWGGGYTVVGEHGPEVVELPKGSKVNDANTSSKMFGQSGTNINISISNMNVRQESDIDSIANALANKIHLEMLNMA